MYVCIRIYIHTHVCVYTQIHIYTCICMYKIIFINIPIIYAYIINICKYTYMYISMDKQIRRYRYGCTFTDKYAYVQHTYIYMFCLYIWICINLFMLQACWKSFCLVPTSSWRSPMMARTFMLTAQQVVSVQHTATHCNTLQNTATHCNKLRHTATRCTTLQHTATHEIRRWLAALCRRHNK